MAKSATEHSRSWRNRNPDKVREISRAYTKTAGGKLHRANVDKKQNRNNPFARVHYSIRQRAKNNGLPYELTSTFLKEIWTGVCPVFGKPISIGYGRKDKSTNPENIASLDRIDPRKGYVKGNVVWISFKANRIKNDGTLEDHVALTVFMATHHVASINNSNKGEQE